MKRVKWCPACKTIVTVDYDIPERIQGYMDVIAEYLASRCEKLGGCGHHCETSPSGGGLHCTCCFPIEMDEVQMLAVRAALLDDPMRIILDLRRLLARGRTGEALFQLKKLLEWRRPTL